MYEAGGNRYWVWDVPGLRLVAAQKLDFEILGADLSPDGRLLALGERPRRLAVLNLANNKERVFLHQGPAVARGEDSGGYGVAWSPKGDMLVACGTGFMREAGEPKCYLFSWPAKKLMRTFPGSQQGASGGWSDGGDLAIRDFNGTRVFEPATGKLLETIDEARLSDDELVQKLYAFGLMNQYDEQNGHTVFPGVDLRCYIGRGGDEVEGINFYAGGDSEVLGNLPDGQSCHLSPDGKVLAVVGKSGIYLLDVKATLGAGCCSYSWVKIRPPVTIRFWLRDSPCAVRLPWLPRIRPTGRYTGYSEAGGHRSRRRYSNSFLCHLVGLWL